MAPPITPAETDTSTTRALIDALSVAVTWKACAAVALLPPATKAATVPLMSLVAVAPPPARAGEGAVGADNDTETTAATGVALIDDVASALTVVSPANAVVWEFSMLLL